MFRVFILLQSFPIPDSDVLCSPYSKIPINSLKIVLLVAFYKGRADDISIGIGITRIGFFVEYRYRQANILLKVFETQIHHNFLEGFAQINS